MAFQILPQEFHVLADRYVIRTRVPVADLTDDMLVLRVRNANLAAGDCVTVQCMSHEYDQLLHEADYRVVSRQDSLKTVEMSDRDIRQINDIAFVIARKGAWWASPLAAKAPDDQPAKPSGETPTIKWNAGKQAHEVLSGSGELLGSFTKEQGGKAAAEDFVKSLAPAKAA